MCLKDATAVCFYQGWQTCRRSGVDVVQLSDKGSQTKWKGTDRVWQKIRELGSVQFGKEPR